ncbi:MAG TPA: DUF5702 domain-containing protein [Anaerovoracaceae bacterium]|nr:DUF5702 domain-containing protein [Anaerovoracaceae bacterium]
MSIMICSFINMAKIKTAGSEINSLSVLWAKAVLSEYDVHLYNDYGIMAYFGHESDINNKIGKYCKYTFDNRNSIKYQGVKCNLNDRRMVLPKNIKKAIKLDTLNINRQEGSLWNDENEETVIRNKAVIETLPSLSLIAEGSSNVLYEMISNGMNYDDIINGCTELSYISKHFNNHVYNNNNMECLFRNEWEYIIVGDMDDKSNFKSVKRKICFLRNALNLAYLYKDHEKRKMSLALAETVCPGPWCLATQFLIMESWSLLETKYDMEYLLKGENVPLIKTKDTWETDIDLLLGSNELLDRLNDEEKDLISEFNKGTKDSKNSTKERIGGLNYEEYLFMYLSLENENKRLLRIMDLIQINMKYRYYDDFNWKEYYNGISYSVMANGKKYKVEMEY